jgi:hypothetical protein
MVQQKPALSSLHKPSFSFWTKSFMRYRRSGFFIAMNDSYACIPPGTPISVESYGTARTHGSSVCAASVGESEAMVTCAVSCRDIGAGYASIERWPLPPLPNLLTLKRCAQFTPSGLTTNEMNMGDEDLRDVTSLSMSNQTSNTIACTDNSFQHRLFTARPLYDENPLNLGNFENEDKSPKEVANASDSLQYNRNDDQNVQPHPSMQVIDRNKDSFAMSSSSLLYITEQELRLSSIPKEIIVPLNQIDDDNDDSCAEEPFAKVAVDKVCFSSHLIRPSPRDSRRQRRQQRPFIQLDTSDFVCEERKQEISSDVSFTDIVCRHMKRSHSFSVTLSLEDECSLPLFIEVNRQAVNRNNFIWRTKYTPEYASV